MFIIWPAEDTHPVPLVIASGRSAVACNCGYISLKDEKELIDPLRGGKGIIAECGCHISLSFSDIHVTHADRHLVDDAKALTSSWYHTTSRANWMEELLAADKTPYVHVGSKLTAMYRMESLALSAERFNKPAANTVYLHELRLKPDTFISPDYMVDFNDWPTVVQDMIHCDENEISTRGEAIRYINIGETPGAISMLIDPRKLEIVSTQVL